MSESLLDECHESILKIAATQPPEGKKAILIMAETFRANAGLAVPRCSTLSVPRLSCAWAAAGTCSPASVALTFPVEGGITPHRIA
jgi:hypothetical protein